MDTEEKRPCNIIDVDHYELMLPGTTGPEFHTRNADVV